MKKVLKIILIVILVLGAIAGSVWLFYSKLYKQKDGYNAAVSFKNSASRQELTALVNTANTSSNSNRFGEFLEVSANLDKINEILVPYLSQTSDKDAQKEICNKIESLQNMQPNLTSMLNEYINKASVEHGSFNKSTGANPVYAGLADYTASYAQYLSIVSGALDEVLNRKADIKFYVIEIYLNVTINTFSNVNDVTGVTTIASSANIDLTNSLFSFNNAYLASFSSNASLFMQNYVKCSMISFAENFATNMNNATAVNGNAENDTAFYLKRALEV